MNNIVCCDKWKDKIKCILFTEEQINEKLKELAKILSEDYANKNVLCVGLMNGCIMFLTHLLEKVTFRYKLDTMLVSSYGHETTSSGTVNIKKDLSIDPSGHDVLIIEDLIDTGITLDYIKKYFKNKKVNSVKICCLLDKKARRIIDVPVDYVGFECPNEFVIGYGMDFGDEFRCCPFIGIMDTSKL